MPRSQASARTSQDRLRRHLLSTACSLVIAGTGPAAIAQDAPAQDGSATQLDTVQVTASRVARGGFSAPTPTTTIGREDLNVAASVNIGETINQLPSVRPSLNPASTTNLSGFAGGYYMDLRGLGFNRTLLLVDGKRFTPTQIQGPVDINAIPQAMISSVDVVTGGASAAWGSDAVAGVVNLVFDRQLEGIRGVVQGGTSTHGDRDNSLVSFAWGQSFAEGRGHMIVSAETSENDGIEWLRDREWGAMGWGTIANPAYTAGNDEPRQLLVPYASASNMTYGGLINAGPLANTMFDASGNPVPFTVGDLQSGTTMQGGDGSMNGHNLALESPLSRHSAYARASFAFSDNLTGFAEASWARSSTEFAGLTRTDTALNIQRENPFIPAAIAAQMDALSLGSIRMGRYNRDYGTLVNDKYTVTERAVVGLEGFFGESWSWDAYYTHGESETVLRQKENRINSRFNDAVDAILDPASGQAVCRSEAARAAGCAPINLFGEHNMSQASLDYILGTSWMGADIVQDAAAVTLRGEPWTLPAGPVSVAAGVEWRREKATVRSDELSTNAAFATGNTAPWSGAVNVKEAFAEAVIPLAADAAWARSFDLNLAGRLTQYSTSGTVGTWKAGATWQINDLAKLRSTLSRDIRAPSLSELYSGGSTSTFSVFDPQLGQTYSVSSISSGYDGLEPEEADTRTIGVVFTPTRNLQLSVDYYDISLDNALITFQAASIVERCFSTHPQVCGLIVRDGSGRIDHVRVAPQNLQSMDLSGVDLELSWRKPLGAGSFSLRALASYIDKLTLDDGITRSEMAGSTAQPTIASIGGQPHWNGNLYLGYQRGAVNLNTTVRYVGGGNINNAYTHKDLDVLEHSGRTYVDIGGSYDLDIGKPGAVSVFAAIRNVADMAPPINGVGGYATTRSLYDVIGRNYTLGMRFNF